MLITLLVLKVRDDKQHGGVATFIMTRFLATIYAFEESLAPKRVKKKKKGSSFCSRESLYCWLSAVILLPLGYCS